MKIYVFPADEGGCGYYRLIWAARALQAQGHDIKIVMPSERGAHLNARRDGDEIVAVGYPPDADVIVLQRITHRHLIGAIRLMRAQGVAVVVDMDDDLAMIHPSNPAFMAMHPVHGVTAEHNWRNAQGACEAATLVTVSTDALLPRYAPHGRGRVLRNCVPRRYLDIPHDDSNVVGWGGSVHSHPDDLQIVGLGVAQAVREGARLRIVGPVDNVRGALRLDDDPEATGPRDLLTEWAESLAELGVGITPLADTRFNAAKSWLKPLEKAAVGVVPIMSPRAEYTRLHSLGIGVLAKKPRDWTRHIRALTTDTARRIEMSDAGREIMRDYTVEGNAWRWVEAWVEAWSLERRGAHAVVRGV